jgi:hypothetical protein
MTHISPLTKREKIEDRVMRGILGFVIPGYFIGKGFSIDNIPIDNNKEAIGYIVAGVSMAGGSWLTSCWDFRYKSNSN